MIHFMKPSVPLLSPLLRSNTQGIVLAALYLSPEREQTPTQLSRRAGVSLPTVLREIDRLLTAGYLTERKSGRNRYVQVDQTHPLYRSVAAILQYTYGPLALLPEILEKVTGIDEAYIYGSWAARFNDEPGADPSDIDVLVIGHIDRTEIYESARDATSTIGREINIHAITREQWDHPTDLFVRNVKHGSLVAIPLKHGHQE